MMCSTCRTMESAEKVSEGHGKWAPVRSGEITHLPLVEDLLFAHRLHRERGARFGVLHEAHHPKGTDAEDSPAGEVGEGDRERLRLALRLLVLALEDGAQRPEATLHGFPRDGHARHLRRSEKVREGQRRSEKVREDQRRSAKVSEGQRRSETARDGARWREMARDGHARHLAIPDDVRAARPVEAQCPLTEDRAFAEWLLDAPLERAGAHVHLA